MKNIINNWIKYNKDARINENCFWAVEKLDDYIQNKPDIAFEIILSLISKADTDNMSANIAAGPLEDFIRINYKKYFDKIEIQARQNPKFRKCLTGVWLADDFNEDIRNIIFKYTKTNKNTLL